MKIFSKSGGIAIGTMGDNNTVGYTTKLIEYKIVTGFGIAVFTEIVNENLTRGWKLAGGAFEFDGRLAQALFREKKK